MEKRLNSTLDQYTKLLPMFFIIVSFMLQKVFCARKAHINAIYGFFVRQTINDKELDHKESLRRSLEVFDNFWVGTGRMASSNLMIYTSRQFD